MAGQVSDGASAHMTALVAARRQKRLTRDRENKRRKKSEYIHELTELRTAMSHLTHQAELLSRNAKGALPWKEVAFALEDDTAELRKTTTRLKHEIAWFRHMCAVLESMAGTRREISPVLLTQGSWRDAYLFQDRDGLRRSGMQWITTSAFANAPHDLLRLSVAADKVPFQTKIVYDGKWLRMRYMHETMLHGMSLEAATATAWHNLVLDATSTTSIVTTLDSSDDSTMYVRHTGRPNQSLQLVQKQYRYSATAMLLVAKSVVDDEVHPYPAGEFKTDGYEWVLVEEVAPNTCLVRQILTFSQPFIDDSHVMSLEEFVPMFARRPLSNELLNVAFDDDLIGQLQRHIDRTYPRSQEFFERKLRQHKG